MVTTTRSVLECIRLGEPHKAHVASSQYCETSGPPSRSIRQAHPYGHRGPDCLVYIDMGIFNVSSICLHIPSTAKVNGIVEPLDSRRLVQVHGRGRKIVVAAWHSAERRFNIIFTNYLRHRTSDNSRLHNQADLPLARFDIGRLLDENLFGFCIFAPASAMMAALTGTISALPLANQSTSSRRQPGTMKRKHLYRSSVSDPLVGLRLRGFCFIVGRAAEYLTFESFGFAING